MNDDLRRHLEFLADRGEPRGADAVLAAARHQAAAAARLQRPTFVAAALAAAVLAVLGTTAVVVHEDAGDQQLAGSAATSTTADWDPDDTSEVAAAPTTTTTSTSVPPRLTRTQRASRLQRYSSCNSLVDASRRKALEVVGPYGLPGVAGSVDVVDSGGMSSRRAASGTSSGGSGGATGGPGTELSETGEDVVVGADGGPDTESDTSATNVQEPGIDEPDTVETDGRRLFTLRGGRLWYSTVDNGRARIEDSIALENPNDMVLVGDRMVVFGNRYSEDKQSAVISVVDVRTPKMGVAASLVFDGYHVSARVVDGVVRAVVNAQPSGFHWKFPADESEIARATTATHNRQVVADAPRDTWLPPLVVEDGLRRVRATRSLVDCDAAYHPQRFSGFGLLSVLSLDPAKPDAVTSTTVQADGDRVYASRDTLYVATNGWQRVEGIAKVVPDPVTLVHAFDISDRTTARYTVSGRVQGTTIGQFAFSEHDGHLRVATTMPQTSTTATSESWVTVLRDNGAVLEQVGQVGGLGRDERIYAVRFIGPLGYVVTFRQTDPLYVVDLSNPRVPRVVGELKIPGFSSYLHPIGPGLLLGVGQDADESGRRRGAQVSVFDVSVPTKPTRLHQVTLSQGSASSVDYDHHAFLWWAPTGLALLPVSEYRPEEGTASTGVIGLSAGAAALRELGRIEHPATDRGQAQIERSVVVGSTVFTVSGAGILASDLATLEAGGWSPYPASTE